MDEFVNVLAADFQQLVVSGTLDRAGLEAVQNAASGSQIPWDVAAGYLASLSASYIDRRISFACADDVVTAEEERHIEWLLSELVLAPDVAQKLRHRITHQKAIQAVRDGELLTVRSQVLIDGNERCHYEAPATYFKHLMQATKRFDGYLVGTSDRLVFHSDDGGWTMDWGSINLIEQHRGAVHIGRLRGQGVGAYYVDDPRWAEAVLQAASNASRRPPATLRRARRVIPPDVKDEVWQRDGGRCVECGAEDSLQFEAVVRFAKGGASTTENLLLRCNACTLSIRDR